MVLGAGGDGSSQLDRGDTVEFGRPSRPPPRRLGLLMLACLVAATVVVVVTRSGGQHLPAPPRLVTVTDVGHPILGIRAGWQLIGLDTGGVVTVQFSRGRIVHTVVPPVLGGNAVSLVASRGEVIVRPLDNEAGYVVPDGEPARRLTGALAQGGNLQPGPTPAEQWLDTSSGIIMLVGPRGKAEHPHPAEPAVLHPPFYRVAPDGRGGLLLVGPSGTVYEMTRGSLRSVSASLLLAVGPRIWLGLQCHFASCHDITISAATGGIRLLPGPALPAIPWPQQPLLPGAVSPDGSQAAVIVATQTQAWLDLINLRTGAIARTPAPVDLGATSQSLAWSPDSRWLFVVTTAATLAVVDARTGLMQHVNLHLSGLTQIVIRPAAG